MEDQFLSTAGLLAEIIRSAGQSPIFRPGDRIRISSRSPVGHYRMPFYLRGKRGLVEAVIEPSVVEAALRMRGCLADCKRRPCPDPEHNGMARPSVPSTCKQGFSGGCVPGITAPTPGVLLTARFQLGIPLRRRSRTAETIGLHLRLPENAPHDGDRVMMMNRRAFSAALVAGATTSLISTPGLAATSAPVAARNVVLVHGLFADGSSWSEVIARLQAAGLNVTSVQNPLTTLPDAVASAQRALALQDGPTVFAGHSFSGMIVTDAGVHPNVSALVYVAARAPDAGEDYAALAKKFPTPPASAGIVFDGDEGRLSEAAFLRDFAGDLPEVKAKVLYAAQWPFQKTLLTGKTTHAAWRSKPSFYAVSTEDRTINPDLERFMAKRMGAKTIEVKASHLSLISHPDEITQLILEAAGQSA
jgi:pimeloyl-ACP methyl ester carboxylesterase